VTTAVQPDIELAVVNFLRSYAPLVSLSAVVGTALPATVPATFTYIIVTRLGGPVRYPGWVANPRLQIDAWADTQSKARVAADTAVAAIFDLPGIRGSSVITGADVDAAPQWLPDATLTPARPRYTFGCLLASHPVPA
jgi:hypothetical protein